MREAFVQITQNLFSYQEFLALFRMFQATLWVLVLVIIVMVVMHILYLLGYQTPLYRKRSPRSHWSRRFFRAAVTMIVLILFVLTGMEWLEKHTPRSEKPVTIFKELVPSIQNLGR